MIYRRQLNISELLKNKSLLLIGPRQTGKSTLIKQSFPEQRVIDLTLSDVFRELATNPELLRQRLTGHEKVLLIDEAQRVPALFDEAQSILDHNSQLRLLLTGSSARKLRRGGVNLLPGRIWKRHLHPLVFPELQAARLEDRAERGSLPGIIDSPNFIEELKNYVGLYLEEEILAEAVTRNVGAFGRFLTRAALTHGEQLNYTNVARDAGVAVNTIRSYYQILYDTLLAYELPSFRKTKTRKPVAIPKFYFFDLGVVNALLGRFQVPPQSDIFGKALESIVFQELRAYFDYSAQDLPLSYWRSHSKFEVDFLVADAVAIEVKAKTKVTVQDEKGLAALAEDLPLKRRIVVCLERQRRRSDSGCEIVPAEEFLRELWDGHLGI